MGCHIFFSQAEFDRLSVSTLLDSNVFCAVKIIINKCVSKTDTNPPFAFQIAFPRGTDLAGLLQGGSKSRDLESEISVRVESRIESADSRLQLQC